jgi:hypothetical protein
VSQAIEHGPEESREDEFWRGVQQAIDLGTMHRITGLGKIGLRPYVYEERRTSGRRYRAAFGDDDEPQEPSPPALAPADMPPEKFIRGY